MATPVPELREQMNLKDGELVLLLKAVYGLCYAPREWYGEVDRKFQTHGWKATKLEPSVWGFYSKGRLAALAATHVDDLIDGIDEGCSAAMAAFKQVKAFWDWGEGEHDHFIQTGLEITQLRDKTIHISFERAARKVDMIEGCTRTRRGASTDTLPPAGVTAGRAVVVGLQWPARAWAGLQPR